MFLSVRSISTSVGYEDIVSPKPGNIRLVDSTTLPFTYHSWGQCWGQCCGQVASVPGTAVSDESLPGAPGQISLTGTPLPGCPGMTLLLWSTGRQLVTWHVTSSSAGTSQRYMDGFIMIQSV